MDRAGGGRITPASVNGDSPCFGDLGRQREHTKGGWMTREPYGASEPLSLRQTSRTTTRIFDTQPPKWVARYALRSSLATMASIKI
jgi:hypothetical protein